jgi:uncharacterized membrane-anchored protein
MKQTLGEDPEATNASTPATSPTMQKLPQVTLLFWVMKIAATTLSETGGDLLAQPLNIGYAASSLLFIGLFVVSLGTQLRVGRFHPALYWTVIVATSAAGTTMSDFMNRSASLGYTRQLGRYVLQSRHQASRTATANEFRRSIMSRSASRIRVRYRRAHGTCRAPTPRSAACGSGKSKKP